MHDPRLDSNVIESSKIGLHKIGEIALACHIVKLVVGKSGHDVSDDKRIRMSYCTYLPS